MKRRELLQHMAAAIPAFAMSPYAHAAATGGRVPMATGPFEPDWPCAIALKVA
jgi:alpha-L-fucosidase